MKTFISFKSLGRVLLALTTAFVSYIAADTGVQAGTDEAHKFSFVAFGDMPYRRADYPKFEALAGTINAAEPAFSIHVGDIKSGGAPCLDETYFAVSKLFNGFENPLIYTPGDNDWSDCDRASSGSYEQNERLEFLRGVFFAEEGNKVNSLSRFTRQADISTAHNYVENVFWVHGGVAFATIHMVGWENNLWGDLAEYRARSAANIAWIRETYQRARAGNHSAVVIAFHADPFGLLSYYSAYRETLATIAEETAHFGRPVLLIHGDRHRFLVDHPMRNPETREILEKLTRLRLFGNKEIRAVEVIVDPQAADPFSFNILF